MVFLRPRLNLNDRERRRRGRIRGELTSVEGSDLYMALNQSFLSVIALGKGSGTGVFENKEVPRGLHHEGG